MDKDKSKIVKEKDFYPALMHFFMFCVKYWNISYEELGRRVCKYNLVDFILEHYLLYSLYNYKDFIKYVEMYMNERNNKSLD